MISRRGRLRRQAPLLFLFRGMDKESHHLVLICPVQEKMNEFLMIFFGIKCVVVGLSFCYNMVKTTCSNETMVWFVPKGLSFPEGTKEDFMKFKKLLALVLSAVMALSILAGCGKNSNYSDVAVQIFDQLMDGKTEMNFEEDADLLKALQDAISQGNGDLSTIRNLVVQALGVKNVFSFSVSGAGAAKDGQHGIAVCRVTGKTPEEAARNAFAQVKGVLEALLANGTYKTYVSMVKSGSDYYLALDLVVVKAGTVSTGTDEGKDEDTEEPQEPSLNDYGETDRDSRHLVIRGDVQSLDKLADAINKANAQFTTVDTVDFTNYQGQIPANVLADTGIEEVVVNASSDVASNAFVDIVAEGKPLTITVKGAGTVNASILGGAQNVSLVLEAVTTVGGAAVTFTSSSA